MKLPNCGNSWSNWKPQSKPRNLENNLQLLKRNCSIILKNGMPFWTLKKPKHMYVMLQKVMEIQHYNWKVICILAPSREVQFESNFIPIYMKFWKDGPFEHKDWHPNQGFLNHILKTYLNEVMGTIIQIGLAIHT